MPNPVLIIASGQPALQIATALRIEMGLQVEIATSRRSGLASLRRGEFSLVLLEESIAAAEPEAAEALYQSAIAAPVLELNFGITSVERVLRQVRATLSRRDHDQAQARAEATLYMQNELKSSLSGLLLESQLALREAPAAQEPKLRRVVELVGALRNRLNA